MANQVKIGLEGNEGAYTLIITDGQATVRYLLPDGTQALIGSLTPPPFTGAHADSHKNGGSDVLKLNEFGNPTGSVQFNQQQALQLVIENRTSDPGSPVAGQVWLRTDL